MSTFFFNATGLLITRTQKLVFYGPSSLRRERKMPERTRF